MADIELSPGDMITIKFAETDGEFQIHFDTLEHPNTITVKETAGLPGNVEGKAFSVLYLEAFTSNTQGKE